MKPDQDKRLTSMGCGYDTCKKCMDLHPKAKCVKCKLSPHAAENKKDALKFMFDMRKDSLECQKSQ